MKKKVVLALLLALVVGLGASAKGIYSRNVNVLPVAARTTLKSNFKAGVSLIKSDKELGRVSEYEVVLNDGCEVTFDRSGNWKDVECPANRSVPDKMVPQQIRNYVKANHKKARIVGIERKGSGYEVELSNGVDIKFDRQGRFLRYD